MTSRIDDIFARLRRDKRTALMPFITAGYPSLNVTEEAIRLFDQAGAHIVELGIPFSDPIADGPIIAASMHDALQSGIIPERIFTMTQRIRSDVNIGLIAMVSSSIVLRSDPGAFIAEAHHAGFDGLIVPDVDLNIAEELVALADKHAMSFSLLISPTTTVQRIQQIASLCRGFVYLLARVGITGESNNAPDIASRVDHIRQYTDLPIAVGFGISTADHVRIVTDTADAAIVGSAIVRAMGESPEPATAAANLVQELLQGLATEPSAL